MPLDLHEPGFLTIAVDASPPPPLHFGTPGEGFEVDLVRAVCARLELTPRYRPVRWHDIVDTLRAGAVDVVCTAATVTEERRRLVHFGRPYCRVELAIVARRDTPVRALDDVRGHPVAVRIATTAEAFLDQWGGASLIRVDFNTDAYRALARAEVRAVVDDSPIAAFFGRTQPGLHVAAHLPGTDAAYAMMFAKGRDALRQAIDAALEALEREGVYGRLYQQWFGENLV